MMKIFKLNDFMNEIEKRLQEPCGTVYQWGGIGRYDGTYGRRTYDCVGILKSILWDYPKHPENYNNTYPDINVGGFKNRCRDLQPFDPNKLEEGMLVFINNEHIGIAGNKEKYGSDFIYEATPIIHNGLQRTSLKDRAKNMWTEMGYADFIDYSTNNDEIKKLKEELEFTKQQLKESQDCCNAMANEIQAYHETFLNIEKIVDDLINIVK